MLSASANLTFETRVGFLRPRKVGAGCLLCFHNPAEWNRKDIVSIKGEKRLDTSIRRFSNRGYWVVQKGYIEIAGKKLCLSYLGKSPTDFSGNFALLQKAAYFTRYFYSGSFPVVQSVFQNKWSFCVQSERFGPAQLASICVPSTLYGSC